MYRIYEAMDSGQCTDDFTADIIMSRLTPIFQVYCVTIVLIIVLGIASVVSCHIYNFFFLQCTVSLIHH